MRSTRQPGQPPASASCSSCAPCGFVDRPVVEVGPFGPDKGQGGKFLFVPPGYKGELPSGYFIAPSKTNRVMYLARGIVKDGDVKSAVDGLAMIRI